MYKYVGTYSRVEGAHVCQVNHVRAYNPPFMIKYDFTEATLCIYREIVNMSQIKAPSG